MLYWAYTHSLTLPFPQLTLASILGWETLSCPQGFTPSLYSQSVLEQGQAEPLPDGNLPHIAIDVFMSHDLLTLHH